MGPHDRQPVLEAGAPLTAAGVAGILVHGRNAGPADILDLALRFQRPDVAWLAPAAANRTWYPQSFMADLRENEPGVSSGLAVLAALVARIEAAGIPRRRIVLAGFSQGACLASEFAIRHASRFGAVLVFSGGAIGAPGTTWEYPGHFDGTPVFLGCSDRDAHVPEARVRETAAVFERMGAAVTLRIYPGMGHLVNDDEVEWAREAIGKLANW